MAPIHVGAAKKKRTTAKGEVAGSAALHGLTLLICMCMMTTLKTLAPLHSFFQNIVIVKLKIDCPFLLGNSTLKDMAIS